MSRKPNAIDESWGRVSPAAAAAAGIKVVYGYLSHDPSKNLTSAQIKAYHRKDVAVWLGWESSTGRPLLGAAAGKADAAAAAAQLQAHYRTLGYRPRNRITVPFSCDQDITAAQLPKILTYYQAARGPLDEVNADPSAYGEYDLVQYLAVHGFVRGQFQAYAWSGGRLSPHAALYQYLNGQVLGGASVDFDRVVHAAQLGAWWPPDSPYNTPEDDDMPTAEEIADAVLRRVYAPDSLKDVLPKGTTIQSYLANNYRMLRALISNPSAIGDAVAASLKKAGITAPTQAQLNKAVAAALKGATITIGDD